MDKFLTISKINIEHFRGLNDLSLDNLSRVNVFAGVNNAGKTSVLEAVRLMSNPSHIGQLISLSALRASGTQYRKNTINYLLSLFQKDVDKDEFTSFYHINIGAEILGLYYRYEVEGSVTDSIDADGKTTPMLELTVKTSDSHRSKPNYQTVEVVNESDRSFVATEKNLFVAMYLHSAVNYYRSTVNMLTDYIVQEGKEGILKILRSFDSNIDDISIVGEDIYLHNILSGTLPLFSYGSGMQKAVFLTVAIVFCKNGVLLIDEIDNTIHVSALDDVFRWFLDACMEYNVQAFITTHSAEALDAILRITHEYHPDEDLLRIITLRKKTNENIIRKRVRSGEEAYHDREKFELELRI